MTIFRGASAALLAALWLSPVAARAGVNVSTPDGGDPTRCSDIEIELDDEAAVRAEERLTIPSPAGQTLRVHLPQNSGAYVRGSARSDFQVLACKGARSRDELDRITLSLRGDALSIDGPGDGEDWVGYLLIAAPAGASLEIESTNGPIALSDLSGRVTARAKNGPIAIKNCPGDIDASAQNGPIAVRGDGGRVRVETRNGPIGVALSGAGWTGEGLDARAINGPVSLRIPAGYGSGAVVESLGHSPFRCRGDVCAAARRTSADNLERIELGDGPAVVRLSTENGPVSVRTGGGRDEDEFED